MRISFLAALAAATALIPAAAQAQNHDRGGWHHGGDRGDRGDRGSRADARPDRPAAPARPQFDRNAGNRGDARATLRPQFPARADTGRFARPDRVRSPDLNRGFDRPSAGRPAQVRADGDWRAQAGGSHHGDRNDWSRDRRGDGQWNRGDDRGGQWTHSNDRDNRWNRDRDDHNRDWNRSRGDHDHDWNRNRGDHDRDWNHDRGRFDHNWRHNDHYDWRDYRVRNRGVFHLPRYYAPYGWDYGYRRFGIGFQLDSILFGSNYWISDPYYYHLPPAYGPYRWVRYYDDALLVDIDTGQVVDVVYDIFW